MEIKTMPEWKQKGHRLKCYYDEYKVYGHFYDKIYDTPEEAMKIIKKLKRHFKISSIDVFFDKRKSGSAGFYLWGYTIHLPAKDIPLGIICHEVAHIVAYMKNDTMGHNKQFARQLKVVYNWAKRYL